MISDSHVKLAFIALRTEGRIVVRIALSMSCESHTTERVTLLDFLPFLDPDLNYNT